MWPFLVACVTPGSDRTDVFAVPTADTGTAGFGSNPEPVSGCPWAGTWGTGNTWPTARVEIAEDGDDCAAEVSLFGLVEDAPDCALTRHVQLVRHIGEEGWYGFEGRYRLCDGAQLGVPILTPTVLLEDDPDGRTLLVLADSELSIWRLWREQPVALIRL